MDFTKKYKNYNKLYKMDIKFQTKFITPIQQIKKLLNDNPSTIITSEQIKNFIENPEPVKPSYSCKINKKKLKEKIIESNISRTEAISRMCDFD